MYVYGQNIIYQFSLIIHLYKFFVNDLEICLNSILDTLKIYFRSNYLKKKVLLLAKIEAPRYMTHPVYTTRTERIKILNSRRKNIVAFFLEKKTIRSSSRSLRFFIIYIKKPNDFFHSPPDHCVLNKKKSTTLI
jgi:hypothetical protein